MNACLQVGHCHWHQQPWKEALNVVGFCPTHETTIYSTLFDIGSTRLCMYGNHYIDASNMIPVPTEPPHLTDLHEHKSGAASENLVRH